MKITQQIPHILGNDVIAIEIVAEDDNGEKVSIEHPIPVEDQKGIREWTEAEVEVICDRIATENNWMMFKEEED